MSRENYDNYDQEDQTYYAADHSASDSINSELLEKKDPAVNQHENESHRHKHTPEYSGNEDEGSTLRDENDTSDPYFQKNATIAQDLDEDLKDDDDDDEKDFDDANRRTLDESKADEDDDEDY